jgi:hypothetical protein
MEIAPVGKNLYYEKKIELTRSGSILLSWFYLLFSHNLRPGQSTAGESRSLPNGVKVESN